MNQNYCTLLRKGWCYVETDDDDDDEMMTMMINFTLTLRLKGRPAICCSIHHNCKCYSGAMAFWLIPMQEL